ncbi:MAG: hypothetical protein RLP45_16165, partial [Haliea sp.]
INLRQPVPTYLVYFTAFATDSGDIAFRRDIYSRDSALIALLRAQAGPEPVSPAPSYAMR